jgi:hypothetical protein
LIERPNEEEDKKKKRRKKMKMRKNMMKIKWPYSSKSS